MHKLVSNTLTKPQEVTQPICNRQTKSTYKWVPKSATSPPTSSINPKRAVGNEKKPKPQVAESTQPSRLTSFKNNKPALKTQVWKPKTLGTPNAKIVPRLSILQRQPHQDNCQMNPQASKASTSHSSILWKSCLLQNLLCHKLAPHIIISTTLLQITMVLPQSPIKQLRQCTS